MRILILIVLLGPLNFSINNAQDTTVFAPLGATWYYSRYPDPPLNRFFKFISEGDTIISGFNAKIIGCYAYEKDEFKRIDYLTKYVSTLGNKVFYRVGEEFVLLFDFGALPGDTIHSAVEEFPIFMGCESDFSNGSFEYSYVIDSISFLEIDGILLRSQFVTSISPPNFLPTWEFFDPIVERIGQLNYTWWGRGEVCLLAGEGFLRCYEDSEIQYRNPMYNENSECDATNLKQVRLVGYRNIYPNPTVDIINLPPRANNIHLYNELGIKFNVQRTGDSIDLSSLQSGIYFMQFQVNNDVFVEKLIKQE